MRLGTQGEGLAIQLQERLCRSVDGQRVVAYRLHRVAGPELDAGLLDDGGVAGGPAADRGDGAVDGDADGARWDQDEGEEGDEGERGQAGDLKAEPTVAQQPCDLNGECG